MFIANLLRVAVAVARSATTTVVAALPRSSLPTTVNLPRCDLFGVACHRRAIVRSGLLVLLLLAGGCAQSPFGLAHWRNPLRGDRLEPDRRLAQLPADEVRQLRELGSRAEQLPASEQESIAARLTTRLGTAADPLVRREIVQLLGQLRVPVATEALLGAGNDPDPRVRIAACAAWQRRGGDEAIAALSGLLANDTDTDVRLAATRALGSFRTPAAHRALAVAVSDSSPALQYRGVQALRASSGRDFGNDLQAWQQFAKGESPQPERELSVADRVLGWLR